MTTRIPCEKPFDSDTIACIAGGIAEAYYGDVPQPIRQVVFEVLDDSLVDIVREFEQKVKRLD